MGWPKGKPRKGYIKPDGKGYIKPEGTESVVEADPVVEFHPELWGMKGNNPITQICPNCAYCYADGLYCTECGWSAPVHREPYGTYSGGKLDGTR